MSRPTRRLPAPRAMIVAPQPEAVEAGLAVLGAGGSAVDAAIAAAQAAQLHRIARAGLLVHDARDQEEARLVERVHQQEDDGRRGGERLLDADQSDQRAQRHDR